MNKLLFFLSLLGLILGLESTATPGHGEPKLKNVILVVMDTTRADAISALRTDGRSITPNIDHLAKSGVIFSKAFSAAHYTTASHMTIFTGLLPTTHGVYSGSDPKQALKKEHKMLAEILKENGYKTFWSGFNSMNNLNPWIGFARGFDAFRQQELFGHYVLNEEELKAKYQILKWLEADRSKPFFLFMHSWTPHAPYLSTPPENAVFLPKEYDGALIADRYSFIKKVNASDFELDSLSPLNPRYKKSKIFATDMWKGLLFAAPDVRAYWSDLREDKLAEEGQFLRGAYEAAVNKFDKILGHFLKELEERKFLKDTLIVIVSDHGEEFLEHGNFYHQSLYNENLHVPLVFSWPGADPKHVPEVVSLVDLSPTIIDLLGIKTSQYFDGQSLKAFWQNGESPRRTGEALSVSSDRQSGAIQNERWKIIHIPGSPTQVFDLKNDPQERNPIRKVTEDLEKIQGMKKRLSAKIGVIVK